MIKTPFNYNPTLAENRWLIILTVMLVAILEVLDSTIVNVSLPNMMPALGANQEQITWVLTSYVVASAMMIPLTGFLNRRLGHRRLLLINISGFMVSSFLCGTAHSLSSMIAFRLLQGAFGAALIPLSQAILRESFSSEEQGKAMAIWGIGIMVAPVFGPTLGGFITEHASWRWIFYINAPICLLGLILTLIVIKPVKGQAEKTDYLGILLMFVGIGSLQILLDQGNSHDWFNSNYILALATASILGVILFIFRTMKHRYPVITLSVFKDRNFTLSTISLAVFAGCLFGIITLEPIMLETLYGYTPMIAGITLSPVGVFSAIGMIITPLLMKKINVRYLLSAALLFMSYGAYYMSSLNLSATQFNFFIANMFVGFGMGLFVVPLSTFALATLDELHITEGAGLFSYGRMLGASIGISLLSTLVTRMTQVNWNQLGVSISRLNNNLRLWLLQAHMTLKQPQTAAILERSLLHQANMIGFIDAYRLIAFVLLLLIPLVLFMKNVKLDSTQTIAH